MHPNTRAVLDMLDAFFVSNKNTIETKELWDVLTALRGPDHQDEDAKKDMTIPIRVAAFPRLAAQERQKSIELAGGHSTRARFWANDPARSLPSFYRSNYGYDHFQRHAVSAAEALGLIP